MDPTRTVRELKVSGHTMVLDPGLYCVFNAPGGPLPSPGTGLPGVRITTAPGSSPGAVAIAAFGPDGWLPHDGGALLRVTEAPTAVLVTVYQDPDATGDAPSLQVLRLSGDAVAAAEPAAPPRDGVTAHVYGRGDVAGSLGDWTGEPGSGRWIEGFTVTPAGPVAAADVEYQAVLGRGWLSPWSEGGQFCGSRGMSLPILGLRVKLRGTAATTHRVQLSGRFVDGTEVGPVADGEPCEAASFAALEAFLLRFEPIEPLEPIEPQPRPPRAARRR